MDTTRKLIENYIDNKLCDLVANNIVRQRERGHVPVCVEYV